MSFTIRAMSLEDLPGVASFHKADYERDHFSSRLSIRLLIRFYAKVMDLNPHAWVAADEKGVVGFVIGGEQAQRGVANFTKGSRWGVLWTFLLNPSFIFKKICARL